MLPLVVCPMSRESHCHPQIIPRPMVVKNIFKEKKLRKQTGGLSFLTSVDRRVFFLRYFRCQCQDIQWEAVNHAHPYGHIIRRFISVSCSRKKYLPVAVELFFKKVFPLFRCRNKLNFQHSHQSTTQLVLSLRDLCACATATARKRGGGGGTGTGETGGWRDVYSLRIMRFLPKFMPFWEAPLLVPYWREMTFWLALSVSSEKLRGFASDLRGHTLCPV